MKLEAGKSSAAVFCKTMKTRRNLIHASIRMVGRTCRSSEAARQRGPTFKWRNLTQIWLLCAAMLPALPSSAQPVTQIAARWHSLFLKSDGSLWAMGDGAYTTNAPYGTNQPEQIVTSNVTAIAAGGGYSLILKSDGSLWAMGVNYYGQLGDGTTNNIKNPEQIVASNVTAIAAGDGHSLFLKSDGSLWAMGDNLFSQLGDGTTNYNINHPEQIVASNVTAVAAGLSHSLFLKRDGSLWAMGDNSSGELGDGTYVTYNPYVAYRGTNQPEQIVASNVTAIAAGSYHSLFLKSDGSLWGMGLNGDGELGDGTYIMETNRPELIVASNVTAIAAGEFHSLFLKSDGSLWAMGGNEFGQLGDVTYWSTINSSTMRPEQIVASGVTAIAAGEAYSLFLKNDGSMWGMGENEDGELGDVTDIYVTNHVVGHPPSIFIWVNRPEQSLAAYNQISGQLLDGTNMQLSFVGVANANYALDRSSSLSPPNWIPQATNPAGSFGVLVFTNTPDAATNNFWRIRSVP